MSKKKHNPFAVNPEKVLQERMKHARRLTREEALNTPPKPAHAPRPADQKD